MQIKSELEDGVVEIMQVCKFNRKKEKNNFKIRGQFKRPLENIKCTGI